MTGIQLAGGAYTNGSYGKVIDPPARDLSFRIGRVYFDRLEPPMPTITIGEATTFRVGVERDRIAYFDERYAAVRDYVERANESVQSGTMRDGSPWFHESHGEQTLVVRIEAGDTHQYVRDYWGVIIGGSDETAQVFDHATMTVEVLALAGLDEYDNRIDVYEEFGR